MSAIMNVRLQGNGETYDLSDFSFTWPLNGSISWNASFGELIDSSFSPDSEFRLIVNGWNSPPLSASIPSREWGIGIGEKSDVSGVDMYHYLASKQGTDLPVYQGQESHIIASSLAGTVNIPVSNMPIYRIPEFKAD